MTKYSKTNPFEVSGWTSLASDAVGADGQHSEPGERVNLPVKAALINSKGVSRLQGFGSLYPVGLGSGISPISYNRIKYFDKDGIASTETVYKDVPVKGFSKGGFWVTNRSVAAYNGDTLLWKLNGFIYEILPGRKVLGYLDDNDGEYGICTVDANGEITDFVPIDEGNNGNETSSNGDTYTIDNDFGTGSSFPRGASTITRRDKKNAVVWEVHFGPTEADDYSGPNHFQRQLAVIENNKRVFVMVTDVKPHSYGGYDPTHTGVPPLTDTFLVILKGEDGSEVLRQKWAVNISNYCAAAGAAWCQIFQLGTDRSIGGVVSSSRFPDPHA